MSSRLKSIIGVAIMSVGLVLYFFLVGVRGVALVASGAPIAVVMGIAVLVLPLIGLWALVRELQFGRRATALADRLEREGLLPEESVETLVSGRPLKEEADAAFPRYRENVEANPDSWAAWMRLGIVYDAAGDRKRARAAIRRAISEERNEFRSKIDKN